MTSRLKVSVVIFAALSVMTPVVGQTTGTATQAAKTSSALASPAKKGEVAAAQLEAAFAEMDGYDYGKERGFLLVIDEAIRKSADKKVLRNQLLKGLTDRAVNGALAYGARDVAMRRLAEIGRGKHVERLEKLLADPDERVAERARQTIGSIPGERSNKALLKALDSSSGKLREGIINSLGQRGANIAVKSLTKIARQDNANEARAAVRALGNIGTIEAGRALADDVRPPDAVREEWFMAMNDAGTALKANKKLAGRLFDRVLQMAGNSPARLAAFKGKALLEKHPEAAALKALDEADAGVAQVARELLVRGNDPSITTQLVARLQSVAPDKKIPVVEILGARGDKSVLDAITQLAGQPADNPGLQVAALKALRNLGNQQSVPMLIKTAAEQKGPVAEAANTTLVEMPVPEVDAELLRLIDQAPTPEEKVAAIEIASRRKSAGTMKHLVAAAGGDNPKVAIAAFKAMAELGVYDDLKPALQIQAQAKDEKVLREGARTISTLAKLNSNPADAVTELEAVYSASPSDEVKASLLTVLGKLGGQKALDAIKQNLSSPNEKLQDTAVRALADFPDAGAMDELMRIATEGKSDVHRVLALRAVARLLATPSAKTSAEVLATAQRALELATAPEEKKAVIGALADVKAPGVLSLIVPFLDQPEFKDESAAAIIKQAPTANLIDPTTTAQLLNPLKEKLSPEQWNTLEKTLTPSETGEKAIRAFQASKTYQIDDGTTVGALLQQQFEPEQGGGEWPQLVWAGVDESGDNVGKADLKTYYTDSSNVAAYLRVHVWSPEDRSVRLDTGSDDGLRAWVNGTQVFAFDEPRGHSWWGDKTKIELKRGWNTIMLKVGQGSVAWEVAARIVDDSDKPVPGLKYSALPQGK